MLKKLIICKKKTKQTKKKTKQIPREMKTPSNKGLKMSGSH